MDKYRCVLEVLKFAGAWEVLHSASLSRTWAAASSAEELWRDLCECISLPYRPDKCAKDEYRDVPRLETEWAVAAESGTVWVVEMRKLMRKSVKVDLALQVDRHTRFCPLSAAEFIACGPSSNTWKLTLRPVVCIYPLSPMQKPRSAPGLLKHRSSLYSFGGLSVEKLRKSIEKYSVREDKWELVGCMNEARVNFQPCAHRTEVYLIGCAMAAELFSTVTCQCSYLQFLLPQWTAWTLAVFNDREIAIITADSLFRARVGSTASMLSSVEIRQVESIGSEDFTVRMECTKTELGIVKYDCKRSEETIVSLKKIETAEWE